MSGREQVARALEAPHVLREYALLADGERGVLVGPRGDFAWMCFPRWDSDAVFSALIGGRGGYAVTPRERFVWGGYYEPGSLIWRSRWVTQDAVIECREALALPAAADRAVVLRRLLAVEGDARVDVLLDPRAGYGSEPLRAPRLGEDGVWRGRLGEHELAWVGGERATAQRDGHGGRGLVLELALEQGARHDLVLVLACDGERAQAPDAERAWQGVESEWRERVQPLHGSAAPRDAQQAFAVMLGLTSGAGGMVAAATTSLPERARQGRNYDYRYAWIRDQCFAGQAAARAGAHAVTDSCVAFVGERLLADGARMSPAYTVSGERVPRERALELGGYPGGTDVIGNRVGAQFQLDAFGEALLLLAAAAEHDRLDAEGWRAAQAAIAAIERRWREPDSGVWELDPRPWAHSRLICAAGLRRISLHAPGAEEAARWMALADRIVWDTASRSLHPSGRWQRAPEDSRPDAALLMPTVRGAIPADDPRALATLQAVAQELTEDGYCYRYRPDERPLGRAEGAFLLCGYWLALSYAQQGDMVSAARWFERNRAACGSPGLFAEEFDVAQRQLRGNLPQAFVHALMLECASVLGGA